jgi:hypothetical protein
VSAFRTWPLSWIEQNLDASVDWYAIHEALRDGTRVRMTRAQFDALPVWRRSSRWDMNETARFREEEGVVNVRLPSRDYVLQASLAPTEWELVEVERPHVGDRPFYRLTPIKIVDDPTRAGRV